MAEAFLEDLICSICLDLFNQPVVLTCGHCFCLQCISSFWDNQESISSCPECRVPCPDKQYTPNRILGNLAQKACKRQQKANGDSEQKDPEVVEKRQVEGEGEDEGQQMLCRVHGDTLAIFCMTDETPICYRCVDSSAHTGHTFNSLKNGAANYKEKLDEALQPLGTRIKELEQREGCQKEKIDSVKNTVVSLRMNIEAKFSELQQFLSQRKEAMLAEMEEDEQNSCKNMEKRLLQIQEGICIAKELMSQGTTQMAEDNTTVFLSGIRHFLDMLAAEEKSQIKEDTDKRTVLCIDICLGKFKGPSQHLLCRPLHPLFKQGLEPVQLDPDTAHPIFSITNKKTKVFVKAFHSPFGNLFPNTKYQINSELLQTNKTVLGEKGFLSGKYYWEVEYNNIGKWLVGVAAKSLDMKSKKLLKSLRHKIWVITLPKEDKMKSEGGILRYRAGVYLDYEEGQLSFYDVVNGSHLRSYKAEFKEAVYPVFWYHSDDYNNEGSLRVCHTGMEAL